MVILPEPTIEKIKNSFGELGTIFLNEFDNKLNRCVNNWELTGLALVDYFSYNVILSCKSKNFGDCILKLNLFHNKSEIDTLQLYNGNTMCKLYNYDKACNVILLERITPGTTLKKISDIHERVNIFTDLWKGMHMSADTANNFPTYMGWIDKITAYMTSVKSEHENMYNHMAAAQNLCRELIQKYTSQCILHGDLHHDNMLLNNTGGYTIIDPKGVIGDPVFDIPRFMLNEFCEEFDSVNSFEQAYNLIDLLEKALNISKKDLAKLLYIETAMGCCWSIEGNCSDKKLINVNEKCEFAGELLDKYNK